MMTYRSDLIRIELARRNMTHEDLEKQSGVSRATISTIVNNQAVDPKLSTLTKIGNALGLTLIDLLTPETVTVEAIAA